MKKSIIFGCLAIAGLALTSCDDFLEDSRYPYTSETLNSTFWSNTINCDQECNRLYNTFSGYGNGASPSGDFYFSPRNDDNANNSFMDWPNINVPASASTWSSPYEWIRHCCYIIDGVRTSDLSASDKANYEGIARLNRAIQFFGLVQKYGDVVWVSNVVDPTDELLYAARTDRDIVMDSVLADLNYAAANIKEQQNKYCWSKDMALAYKSNIALWEGTYCKYRTQADNGKAADNARANKYLQECVSASEALMARYSLNAGCTDVYINTINKIGSDKEWIFGKAYKETILTNALIGYLTGTTPINGLTKDCFEAFLFIDGKPLGLTAENSTDVGVWDEDNHCLDITNLLAVRDGRLAKIIDPVVYYAGKTDNLTYARQTGNQMTSTTGYGIRKYDDLSLPTSARDEAGKNYTCAPLCYFSVVLCNYAEAQAELGQLTQAAADKSINLLYARAGLPALQVGAVFHDPANTKGVNDLVWEARRNRRCELVMDLGYRYWDLVRWHELDKLDSTKNPNIKLGANWKPSPVEPNYYEGDYINGYMGSERRFDKKYYFYPIPSGQITLNPNLGQNPGW